jgi:hypothetical protein
VKSLGNLSGVVFETVEGSQIATPPFPRANAEELQLVSVLPVLGQLT